MRIVCAGDDFISPDLFVEALHRELGNGHEYVTDKSDWPHEPQHNSEEVREWVGDETHLKELLKGAHVLITHCAPVTEQMLESAAELQLISCCRGGPVNVNVGVATRHGIPVAYTPGRNGQAVAEFTIGVMIAGMRRVYEGAEELKRGEWAGRLYAYDLTGVQLTGRTIGLVGLGQVGSRVARLLRSFGCRVIGYDPYVDDDVFTELGVEIVDFDTLLERSDIVSLHPRLTQETRAMINRDTLARMRRGAYLVNTSRGPVVDQAALYEALESGQLSGAALDTYEVEPPKPDDPLLRLPQVLPTPHIAGASQEVAHRAARLAAAEVGRFLRGELLLTCANPEVLKGR